MSLLSRSTARRTPQARKEPITEFYGENVFSIKTMRDYLSENAHDSLVAAMREGRSLDPTFANDVADAMKTWAVSRGATHYSHWFQPLTGTTAEKHDAFIVPDRDGGVVLSFSSKELIRGEPDASSFPSGGLRATFEARGYTAWDPTSPAFIREGDNGATLCIPTVFYGYHGDALDKKTPLLRSIDALSKQVCRLARLFGMDPGSQRASVDQGIEQEYFLIDKRFFGERLDLLQTGRTLFGRPPAKHQQMEDHYFGAIKDRVLSFMEDLDHELWRLGIPAKTRHNEVCPAQFEIAPVFEELNLAVDHNMLTMEILRQVAHRHNFACLLHEKPFAGVNGSGKHNNWNISGPDGTNWLKPGANPHEDAKFLTTICAILKAVDTHADILRASVASAGNDHRLGANEAPPAIMSIFLGEQLTEVLEQIGKSGPRKSTEGELLDLGLGSLPPLPRDATDRNRTSPFAFTGTKFEFRAVGSDQNCADPNTFLNTIVAESLDEMCSQLEAGTAAGETFNACLQRVLSETVQTHGRIIFNGDNYTEAWRQEAARRQLPNVTTTPEALKALTSEKAITLFEKHGVLSRRELESRYEVYRKKYEGIIDIEVECAVTMVKTMILPAAMRYAGELAACVNGVTQAHADCPMEASRALLTHVARLTEKALNATAELEALRDGGEERRELIEGLRKCVDELEGLVPDDLWPLPSYADMMFTM